MPGATGQLAARAASAACIIWVGDAFDRIDDLGLATPDHGLVGHPCSHERNIEQNDTAHPSPWE